LGSKGTENRPQFGQSAYRGLPITAASGQGGHVGDGPEAIVIADYGLSEGHNSLAPMGVAIRSLRDRVGPEREISVVHTDLPGSDFSALFETLHTDPDSYLRFDSATFASAVGRSFYQQILPSGSVTLGWSSWAVQWLSRTPAPIPDQLQVAYSRGPVACAAYTRQATEDRRTFLAHRGRELRPGGAAGCPDHGGQRSEMPAIAPGCPW
jgi:hypothetical protein